jgi:hypothetical protein
MNIPLIIIINNYGLEGNKPIEGGHLGLGSMSLIALRESEGSVACQERPPGLTASQPPHTTLSNGAFACVQLGPGAFPEAQFKRTLQ